MDLRGSTPYQFSLERLTPPPQCNHNIVVLFNIEEVLTSCKAMVDYLNNGIF